MKTEVVKLTIIIILIGISIAQGDANIDPKTIILTWPLDGDIKDSSGQGNDGVIEDKPKWVKGKSGKALEFDGKDDYVISPQLPIYMGKPFTVGAWVKPASPVAGDIVHISSQIDGGGWCHPLIGIDLGGKPGFFTYTGPKVVSETALTANEWAYVAGVHDGKKSLIYVYVKEMKVASVAVNVSDSGGVKYIFLARTSVVIC